MASDYPIIWTEEAIRNLEAILDYLQNRWTQREVDNFKKRLSSLLVLISGNPKLFPKSEIQPRLRKAVLSKQTIIFYEFKHGTVYLIYLFGSSQNPVKIK
ncbi:MAG: type II toxin-antitoxin system RelE/ParE family toxin [Bacteroidales bacterium]|nr:type II toxin-antitoxin system RelE/ParE family toxin [Bacteroidales bacterium]